MTSHSDQPVDDLIREDHREAEMLFASLDGDPERVRGELVRALATHSVAEETTVYPMLLTGDTGDTGQAENELARHQHERIKHALLAVDRADPNDAGFAALVRELEDAVSVHVRHEEEHLLPLLRDQLGGQQLQSVSSRFLAAKTVAPTRPHPHAPDSAIGHVLADGPASVMDRVRDALDPNRP